MLRLPTLAILVTVFTTNAGAAAEPLHITTTPIALHQEDDQVQRVGRLIFLGGLHLKSSDQRFGGLSGLAVSSDGKRLSFVTDKGSWIQVSPRYDSRGFLIGIAAAQIGPLLRPDGQPVRRKRDGDAESLFRTKTGFLVSFEQKHRFWHYRGTVSPFLSRPKSIGAPKTLSRAHRNRGIEAAAVLPDGRLFALSENFPKDAPYVAGWLRESGKWRAISYERTALFYPTGAAVLPNGDLLILERRFTFVGGFATRFVQVPVSALKGKKAIRGLELGRLEPPLVEENFEGLDIRRESSGRTLVYIVSDDNFFPLQKTLLMMFAIDP